MNHQKLSLIFAALTLCGVVTFMSVVARPLVALAEPSPTGATIASDYPDYVPGATVTSEEQEQDRSTVSTAIACYIPEISNTAAGAYDERHEWDVEKLVNPNS